MKQNKGDQKRENIVYTHTHIHRHTECVNRDFVDKVTSGQRQEGRK